MVRKKGRTSTTPMLHIPDQVRNKIDTNINARVEYERRVVSKDRVLDIGGRSNSSDSRKRIVQLSGNAGNTIVSTDILVEYGPDLVDDICNTSIKPNSFDGIYCNAILEHVTEYWNAIDNIHSILSPEGEAFIYVPFCFYYHDKMDFHRFTFTEVARMLERFSEVKVFMPGKASGYGYVFWSVLTMAQINRFPRLHELLTVIFNSMMKMFLHIAYKMRPRNSAFSEWAFFWVYLFMNHGFCAWCKK